MSKTISALVRPFAVALFLCFLLPAAASAVQHEVRILMDLDDDEATGCLVNTVDGPFDGVDQILITTVETTTPPEAGTVTDVATSDCVDPGTDTFSAPASFDGGWPVGIDNGVGGRDVVETYFPLVASVVDDPMTVRLGVVVTDENGGEQALLTEDDSPDGPPILLVFPESIGVPDIPTLGEWGLILLSLLLAAGAFRLLGRRGSLAMVAVLALLAAGVAWAAVSLDGQTTEWSPADQLASNGIVLFGMVEGDNICFRVDVNLVFNSGPEAVDDAYPASEDAVLNTPAPGVLANDSDPDSDPLTVTDHDPTSAQGAVVNVNADGSFSYDPTGAAALQALDDGETVDDTFTYEISDGTSTDTATVTVTVTGANDAPIAMDDTYETDEDTPLNVSAPGVLVNDDDVDGEPITAVLDSGPTNAASFTLNPDGSFSYTPAMDFNGVDSFTYHASDGTADSPTVTATITVGPVNDGPNAVDDSFMTDEDTALNEAAPGVLVNDTDPEMDAITVTASDTMSTMGATVSVNADGSFTYDPTGSAALQALDDGEMADDTFTYTIDDGSMNPDTATVTVMVTGANDAPVAGDDAYMTDEDTPLNEAAPGVLGNDTDVDVEALTAMLVTGPSNAVSFILNMDGSFDYTPAANFNGVDSFTYRANDGTVDSNLATVTITVNAVNDPPVAVDDTVDAVCNLQHVVETDAGQTAEDSAPVFRTIVDNVLADDSDPVEMDAVSIVSVAAGMDLDSAGPEYTVTTTEGGTVTVHPDGSFVYTPQGGDRSVADTFTYTIQDAEGAQDTATVTLNVGSSCVWFVDNSVNTNDGEGDGTSSDPFSSLVDELAPDALPDDAEDASLAGDVVYVFTGNSDVDPYGGGYTAQANERILGEGVDLVVDLGGGPETLFDSTDNIAPSVDGGAENGFDVIDVDGVEIAGFDVESDAVAIQVETTAGSSAVSIHDNMLDGDTFGLQAAATGGTLEVAIDDNTDIVASLQGIFLVAGAGDLNITSFCGNTVHGDTTGDGIVVSGATFDADPSTGAFDEVECTAGTTLGSSGNRVGRSGLVLQGITGDLDLGPFNALVGAAGGADEPALQAISAGVFDAGTGTGFQLTTDSGIVDSIDGPALDVDGPSLENVVLTTVRSQNSDTVGVGLVNVSGSFTTNGGDSSITEAAGDAFAIVDAAGSLAITYDGDITNSSMAALLVDGHPAGTVTFTGGTITATGGTGLQFDDADGAYAIQSTANLNGGDAGVDIVNGSGGTFTFTGTSITSPTGPGIRVADSAPSSVNFSTGGSLTYATAGQPAVLLHNRGAGTFAYSRPISATDGTGLRFNNDDGTTTTFNNAVTLNGGDAGVDIVNGSSSSYTFSNTTITSPTGVGFNVDSSSGGITWSAGGVTQANAVSALRINSHSGGIVTISAPVIGNTATANAVDLIGVNGGSYNLRGGLDLDTTTGTAFNATGGGTVNVCADSACNGTGGAVSNTVDTTGAAVAGVNFVNTTIGTSGVTFATVNVNGAADGINLTQPGAGDFAALGGTIQNVTARGVDVSGGSGDVRVDASIDTTTAGRSVEVTTHTGGTVDFNGFIDDDGLGIRLASNVGAVLRFDGGMDVDTANAVTEEGFQATGGGTLHVTGTNDVNTSLGTGIAVNIEGGTTIGSDDVTFRNVSADGAPNGIVLDSTGTSGDFTVTGDGSNTNNNSGGIIQNTSDHGIVLTSTEDVSLTSIRIANPGDAASEHGISATGLRGTNLLRASTITGFDQTSSDGFRVVNNNLDLTELRVNNSTFSASDGNDGLAVFAQGNSMIGVVVENGTLFTDLEGDAIDIIAGELAGSTATVDITIDDNDFTNAGATGNGGIQARTAQDGNLTGSITNNTFDDTHRLASTAGVIEIQGNNTGSVNLTVSGNDLDTFNQSGINVVADDASDVTVDIDGNLIDTNQNDKIGIRASLRNTGATRLTIQNNQVGQTTALPGVVGTRSAIDIEVFDDTGSTDDVRILIDNNQLRVNKTSGTSEVVDIFVDQNADAHVTMTNNTLTNIGSGDGAEIVTDTAGTTLCLDLRSNTATNPGPSTGDIELVELAGIYSVEALASVVANNPNANIVFDPNMAAFSNAASCLTP